MFKFKKTPISCWRRQLDVNKKFMMLIFCRVSDDWMSHIRSDSFTVLLIFCFVLLFLLHIQNGEDKSHRFCFPPTSFSLKLFSVYWLFVSASQLVNTFVYVTKFTLRFVFIINTAKKNNNKTKIFFEMRAPVLISSLFHVQINTDFVLPSPTRMWAKFYEHIFVSFHAKKSIAFMRVKLLDSLHCVKIRATVRCEVIKSPYEVINFKVIKYLMNTKFQNVQKNGSLSILFLFGYFCFWKALVFYTAPIWLRSNLLICDFYFFYWYAISVNFFHKFKQLDAQMSIFDWFKRKCIWWNLFWFWL